MVEPGRNIPTDIAEESVLVKSAELPKNSVRVAGYDFNEGIDYSKLLQSYKTSGFQATNLGLAIDEINKMISSRNTALTDDYKTKSNNYDIKCPRMCTIYLGYTSNLISCGIRETIRYLVQHKMVDVLVTSAGGVEEDFIKCLAPTYLGDFSLDGRSLRSKGINRIGNLLVPNDNYLKFEEWFVPILDQMLKEQKENGIIWSPSKIIKRLGEEINDTSSVYYWAARNDIPVFCPAITDGSIGDMIFMHSYRNPGLIVDLVQDIRGINSIAMTANETGMIIMGGGVTKHHICNANLMRNGADYSVYINTGQEFDGSDAGARPDEAMSWGKIKPAATPVKLHSEASLVFPLIVGETFAKDLERRRAKNGA